MSKLGWVLFKGWAGAQSRLYPGDIRFSISENTLSIHKSLQIPYTTNSEKTYSKRKKFQHGRESHSKFINKEII